MNPIGILKHLREFLEAQADGFDEVGRTLPPAAAAQCAAAAQEARDQAANLGPLFAVLESRDVVLNHVRSSLESALVAEREKPGADTVVLGRLQQVLEQTLPLGAHRG